MGAPDTEKYDFWSIWVVLWSALGVFWGILGIFFSTLFVGMRLCGCRVFKVVSYVMLHGMSCLQGSLLRYVTWHSSIFWHLAVQQSHTQENWQSGNVFSGSSRDGFLRFHDATTFVFIQSQLAPHFIAFRHCHPHGSLFDILYNLKWSHSSMVLLYLATLSLGSLNCMVWHPFDFAWDSFKQRDVI